MKWWDCLLLVITSTKAKNQFISVFIRTDTKQITHIRKKAMLSPVGSVVAYLMTKPHTTDSGGHES